MSKNKMVAGSKEQTVEKIAKQMKESPTIMVVSIKGLPSRQYQDIKKTIRDKGSITVTKKNLLNLAIENAKVKGLEELQKFITDGTALLYGKADAFEISGILARAKSPQKAKAGQIAPMDIEVKAGPTQLVPGPDISALSAVGLVPKVENGKIAVLQDKVIVKEGDTINEAQASIMAKLDIIPFKVGIEPIAAFMDGVVYDDIVINVEEMVTDLEEKYARALPFAVEIGYINEQTLDFILAKAAVNANAIEACISEDAPESKEEVTQQEPSSQQKATTEPTQEITPEAASEETKSEENSN